MTKQELEKKKKELKNDYDSKLKNLCLTYAIENSVCEIGDFVVEKHNGKTGKIIDRKMDPWDLYNNPEMIYRIAYLTKKMTLYKNDNNTEWVYRDSIKEVLPKGSVTVKE